MAVQDNDQNVESPKHFKTEDIVQNVSNEANNDSAHNDKNDEPNGSKESNSETQDKSKTSKKKGTGKKIAIVIIILLAIACIGAGGYMMWKSQQPVTDPGATIQSYDGKSDKEIQDELNRQAEESRMTISVAPKVTLKDGKARVNVVNANDNRFNQEFTLSQDGKDIYKSGIIKSGEKVEWCEANGIKTGSATITVQAVDKESGKPSGNPQSVDVEVVNDSESDK